MAIHLSTPVSALPGIGSIAAKDMRALGIRLVRDLLMYFPFRYDDFSVCKPIALAQEGETVTIAGALRSIKTRPAGRNRRLKLTEAIVEDESGSIKVVWFNQPYLEQSLRPGMRLSLAGRVETQYGRTLVNPVLELPGQGVHTGRLVPVYGLTGKLTMRRLRAAIQAALVCVEEFEDWLPASIIEREGFASLAQSISTIHFPQDREALDRATDRLKFNELFLHQLLFAQVRRERTVLAARAFPYDPLTAATYQKRFPFDLTNAQQHAIEEVLHDLGKTSPMNRLLEGDVGSGKTAVAAMAIAHVAEHGGFAAYLAPTEILAVQQEASVGQLLGNAVALLTSSASKIGTHDVTRAEVVAAVQEGTVRCLVGTHALLEESLALPVLDLIIIDEQHRFGVEQRHALLKRSEVCSPHLLSMSATPIPRSLALTLYGDLDLSILDELPRGRKPIVTELVGQAERRKMWDRVLQELTAGHQAYIVCPLIDPSDRLGVQSATEVATAVKKTVLKSFRVGVLHGKLSAEEKEEGMRNFKEGNIDVLVSTTVVEVGVDVPNATVMIVVGAERFGLAQLHQLRGRVGRSDAPSFCFLRSDVIDSVPPLPNLSPVAKAKGEGGRGGVAVERLRALVDSTDGFVLAQKDLELRGAGDVFGTAQSGLPDFQLVTLSDVELMKKTRDEAARLLEEDPMLEGHPLLAQHVRKSFDQVHLE